MLTQFRTQRQLDKLCDGLGMEVKNLDDCLKLLRKQLAKWGEEGVIGVKLYSKAAVPPNAKLAAQSLKRLLDGEDITPNPSNTGGMTEFEDLENFLTHNIIDMAAELDMVIAVHSGVFGDWRKVDSKNMHDLAPAHPKANFDLSQLGMPSVRDTIVIGKNYPNVFLNLTWSHIVSQVQACSGIDEILDQVPVNKILAFGGDYARCVEEVVGHLHMARENFAQVFGRRIDRDQMSFDQACEILKLWFWGNPLNLYTRLKIED